MINPWTKNPALSLWMSGANAVFGAARSRATAEMHRQMTAAMTESTRQMMAFWSGAAFTPTRRKRKTSR